MRTFDDVKLSVHRTFPDLDIDSAEFKTVVVEEVSKLVGLSDTKIAKFTGYSRGFVIPRVKKIKKNGLGLDIAATAVVEPLCLPQEGRPKPQKAELAKPIDENVVDRVGAVRFFG